MELHMFEQATRNHIRFHGSKGMMTVEDLWSLTLNELDRMYRKYKGDISPTDGLLTQNTPENEMNALCMEVIKRVFEIKQASAKEIEMRLVKKEMKQKLTEVLAEKQNESLRSKSEDELLAMINAL